MIALRLVRAARRVRFPSSPPAVAAATRRFASSTGTASPLVPTAKAVATSLLQIISSPADIAEYLKVYGTPGVTRTTVIKIGGEVIENELETLVQSLIFLKEAGLFPILVHGAGPQMNAALAAAGVEPQYVQGNRVTDAATLAVAKRIFLQANRKIVDALVAAGAPARPITSGVFEATFKDHATFGYVGQVSHVHGDSVQAAVALGQIPVLSCLGETADGQTLNINADVAARELAIDVQPYKTVFINAKGGWIEDDGTKLRQITMATDYARMAARDYTGRQGTLLKLNEIHALLQHLPASSSVALTSAAALSNEILSSCSAGTVCIRGRINTTTDSSNTSSAAGINTAAAAPKKFRVGLLGARGYVGREIIRLLGQHPQLELVCASSRALVGHRVVDAAHAPPLNPHTHRPAVPASPFAAKLAIDDALEFCDLGLDQLPTSPFAESVDVWILALPNGHCEQYAAVLDALPRKDKVVIDLSADQRFNHAWVYGLPETPGNRTRLHGATHIANPGCYATAAQLGLLPLLGNKALDTAIPPHVFGVSGYSGAGTGRSAANNLDVLSDNLMAYKSVGHIHEREVSHQLATPVRFMPHVAPFFQGIHLTLATQLRDASLTEKHVHELYADFFANDRLVQVTPSMPLVKDNARQHHVTLGGFQIDPNTGRLVVIATIDNLLKGAATQAVQNINVSLGIDEYAGILPSSSS